MSEEIVENNEVQNPVNEQEETEQVITEQNEAKGGSTQTEEKQKEETKPTVQYTKVGREIKQKVTLLLLRLKL